MQIAIIGAGVSGLATYLFFVKHLPPPPPPLPAHDYKIYESHTVSDRKKGKGSLAIPLIGSGIGIAPNGMNVLRELDQSLHDEIQNSGFPAVQIEFKNARGWHLGSSHCTHEYNNITEATLMVSRQDVIEAFLHRIPKGVITQATVTKVTSSGKDEERPDLEFADGTSRSFDLVIGADGVWSKARSAILNKQYDAHYTGLFGVSGFFPTSLITPVAQSTEEGTKVGQCVMTFSGDGFFGYTPCTTSSTPVTPAQLRREEPITCGPLGFWWSTFESESHDTRSFDIEEMRKKLYDRHKHWTNPTVQRITQSSDLEIMGSASWVMPKAPMWAKNRIVLVGDAAHALPSTSGQGISQSLLDAQALSLLIAHHFQQAYHNTSEINERNVLEAVFQHYMQVRKPIVERIFDMAQRMANQKKAQSTLQEWLMYGALKVIFTFFSDSMQRPTMHYSLHAEIKKAVEQDIDPSH